MRQRTIGGKVRPLELCAAVALAFLPAAAPRAQSGDAHDLATALSNPLADLVSVPFQFNWEERFQVAGGFGYFVDSPAIGPERKIRITFTLILPRSR